MSTKAFRLSTFFFVIFLAISAAGFEFLALAQESTNQNAAADTSTPKAPTTRRRRGRRHKAANTNMATDATVPAAAGETPVAAVAETSEQTDLSGTYTGTFECGDAGVTGPTTLTITGNQFTLADGKAGRIVASTTRGYTGVAMQFGELGMATPGQPAGPPPIIVSMRAKKSGDRLTLTTVPGAMHVCSFTTGAMARTRHRRARAAATPAAAMPAEPAMPADVTATPATPAEPAAPAKPARRRGRRGNRNTNTNTNMNTNTNTNDNTGTGGEGNMNATPTPTPSVPRN